MAGPTLDARARAAALTLSCLLAACGAQPTEAPEADAAATDGARPLATDGGGLADAFTPDTGTGTAQDAATPVVVATNQENPARLAVDTNNLYFTNPGHGGGTVVKVALAGGTPVVLASGQNDPQWIAVDQQSVYWIDDVVGGSVMKVGIDGGAATTLAPGLRGPEGIALDAQNVYWCVDLDNTVMRVSKGGGTPAVLTTIPAADNFGGGIAVDSTSVYFTTSSSLVGSVMKLGLGLDPGAPVPLASGQSDPTELVVDATSIYWINQGSVADNFNDGSVMKVAIAGGAPVVLASSQRLPFGIAVDGTHVYWTIPGSAAGNFADGTVMTVPLAGGVPSVLAQGGDPNDIVVDSTTAYWVDNFGSEVMRVAKP